MVNDILLDSSGDVALTEENDLILADSLKQRVNVQLRWFKGEWPFDRSKGMDWFDSVFVKNPDPDIVELMIRNVIQGVDGITGVESVTVDVNEHLRTVEIKWKAKSDENTLESEVKLWEKYMV